MKRNKKSAPKKDTLAEQRRAIQSQVNKIQLKVKKTHDEYKQKEKKMKEVLEIESMYRKKRLTHFLNLNKTYMDLKNEVKLIDSVAFENKVSNLNAALAKAREKLSEINQQIKHTQEKQRQERELSRSQESVTSTDKSKATSTSGKQKSRILSKPKFSPLYLPPAGRELTQFYVDWENVIFDDGFIVIIHNGRRYRKDYTQSKKCLNQIKHYYTFHNIPMLNVILSGSTIKSIENQEILFYHIDFLSVAASNFDMIKLSPFRISNWKKYTKQHYKDNLPFVLHTATLKKLCEYCDSDLPIIPVGEAVINSSGSHVIHNSFLFPLKSNTGYLIVWESVEEAKASYVFSLKSFTDENVQTLFDYIAGNTTNKRSTLIGSKDLQNKLNLRKRLFHADFSSWDKEIQALCQM